MYMNMSLFSVAGIWPQKSDDFRFCGFAKHSRRRCVENLRYSARDVYRKLPDLMGIIYFTYDTRSSHSCWQPSHKGADRGGLFHVCASIILKHGVCGRVFEHTR